MLSCSYFVICQVLQLVAWLRGCGSETLVFLIWIDGKKRVTGWEENLPYVFIYFLSICITHRFVLFTRAIAGRVVNFWRCVINNRTVPLCCSLERTFLCVLLINVTHFVLMKVEGIYTLNVALLCIHFFAFTLWYNTPTTRMFILYLKASLFLYGCSECIACLTGKTNLPLYTGLKECLQLEQHSLVI